MSDCCFICGEDNQYVLEEHHIIPRRYDGGDDDANLVTLCSNCHRSIEQIYSDDIWTRINLCTKWDPSQSPNSDERVWKERTLRSQLEKWKESKLSYLETRVDYSPIKAADPVEADSKEVAYQLGRYQAYQELLRYLRGNSADELLEGQKAHI